MRALTFILMLVCSSAFAAEDTSINQDSTSIASPSSSMSNVQVNQGALARSTFGNGVSCSEATLSVAATKTPEFGNYYTATYSVPVGSMFETSDCEKAAKTQNGINRQILTDMQVESLRQAQLYNIALAKKEAELAKLCMSLHGRISASEDTTISALCYSFAPIEADHHLVKVNANLMPDNHSRVSPTKGSWGE